ncbi:hypothetical protein CesoFtcFv8_001215 [Champsocephalus esox]|uniref:Uncharacterized protein n=1 Tax=Champsocephalus esox TaxID=159716 RepID=A0AAN8DD58_9TELE|nr:hypothetical protein CesoFtcFv8_001215 [Champsocephalus esox]
MINHRIVCGHCPFSLADVPFVLSNSSHRRPPHPSTIPTVHPVLSPRILRPICNPIPPILHPHIRPVSPCTSPKQTSCLGRSCPWGRKQVP